MEYNRLILLRVRELFSHLIFDSMLTNETTKERKKLCLNEQNCFHAWVGGNSDYSILRRNNFFYAINEINGHLLWLCWICRALSHKLPYHPLDQIWNQIKFRLKTKNHTFLRSSANKIRFHFHVLTF